MSSSVVTTLAWLGVAGVVVLGVVVALLYRRTRCMARALTDAKWDLVVLRAEVGALHRQVHAVTGDGDEAADAVVAPGVTGIDGTPARTRTASPTAWRRDRSRSGPGRPRRRRPT